MRQSILHAEVSHAWPRVIRLHVDVFAKVFIHPIHLRDKLFVFGDFTQPVEAKHRELFDRIFSNVLVEIFVQTAEKVHTFRIPRPPKIVCEFVELFQFCGNMIFNRHLTPYRLVGVVCFYFHNDIVVSMFYTLW